jgi:hypothetical protein
VSDNIVPRDIITHRAVYNYGFSLGRILSLTELFTTTVSPLAGYYHSQSCLQLWFLPWQDIITHRAVYNYGFSGETIVVNSSVSDNIPPREKP